MAAIKNPPRAARRVVPSDIFVSISLFGRLSSREAAETGMEGLTSDVSWAAAHRYRQGGSPHVRSALPSMAPPSQVETWSKVSGGTGCLQPTPPFPPIPPPNPHRMYESESSALAVRGLEGNASVTSNVSACAPVITAARKHSWGEKRPSLIINLAAPTELAGGKLNFEALLPNKVCCTLPCEKGRIHVGLTGL